MHFIGELYASEVLDQDFMVSIFSSLLDSMRREYKGSKLMVEAALDLIDAIGEKKLADLDGRSAEMIQMPGSRRDFTIK
jgi:hypothetical protein